MVWSPPARIACALALVGVAASSACATADVPIGTDCADGFCNEAPSFTPPPDGGEAAAQSPPSAPRLLCIGTECPAPYATCAETPGAPATVCGTNLMNDSENCGACGVSCQGFSEAFNMAARCVDGACAFECQVKGNNGGQVFRNCNGILDDGCEVDIMSDEASCGGCGQACPPGVRCITGKCGCSPGRIDCNTKCIDPRANDDHCGACGNACQDPAETCSPMPPNTKYGCVDNECGKLKCDGLYADCNDDLNDGCASDGCEVDISTPESCGACGKKCLPDETCQLDDQGRPDCRPTCESVGLVACNGECVDLQTDAANCGRCFNTCVYQRPNAFGTCNKGICGMECSRDFADCNGDPIDGCEVDLRSHPANCGTCGHECDLRAGQPCVDGQCLMVECDAGVETK